MLNWFAADQTQQEACGARLSAALAGETVIYLRGDLGAGKTTLVRGFLRGLGYAGAVKSPTYTLMEPYEIGTRRIYHLDLYRLGDPGELEYLGIRDLLGLGAVMLVEWPDRGAGELPPADLSVDIEYRRDGRQLQLSASTDAGRRLLERLSATDA
jgi:tRNA threonylcarbamoyladenosine biosynthesis protein TsaE